MSTKNSENYQKLLNLDRKLKNFSIVKITFSQNSFDWNKSSLFGSRSLRSSLVKSSKSNKSLAQNLTKKNLTSQFCLLEIYDKKIVCKLNYSIFDRKFQKGVLLKYIVDLK